jgi:AmmeMemoRadiSam system protein A
MMVPRSGRQEPVHATAGGRPGQVEPAQADSLPAPIEVDDAERAALLEVARRTIAASVGAESESAIDAVLARYAGLRRCGAAFVTLTEDDALRGCMGAMDPSRPAVESVAEAAACASRWDPRFRVVSADELPRIEVEVSVLGPLVPLRDPSSFRLGIDGIVVRRGDRRGLLLPEVACMLGNDRIAMLETTCRKAGLPAGAWRDPDTEVFAFRTARFGGPALPD